VEGARGGRGDDLLVGNGRDNVLDGGPGDDQVEGGAGVDRLRGGSGRDFVVARDGIADAIRCGTKPDLALVDGEDEVVAALSDVCERVDGGGSRPARRAARVGPASSCLLPFRPRGASRVFLLSMRAALPWATKVDASSCTARLRGARGTPAGRRAAELSRGAFSIRPMRRGALIRLGLRGGTAGRCDVPGIRVRRLAISGAPPGIVVSGRRLSARGAGASWITTDGCRATAVRVRAGRLRVFDETRRRRLVLRSGRRHVAPWRPQAGARR
jgi:Ca2+-binding RTX toxin-like protein